jgi:hypothetical protein
MRLKVLLATVMLAGLLCVSLPAAPIFGTFDLAGNVTVTEVTSTLQTITWTSLISNLSQKSNVGTTHTNSFSILGTGDQVTIDNLNNTTEPVGMFPQQPFIAFDTQPSLPVLMINQVFAGIFSTTQCMLPPTIGQVCTPNIPGGSTPGPFNLSNQPGGGGTIQSTASFTVAGVTADGLSMWTGVFSSNFNQPYQTTLATFAAMGSVTNTYSGTIVVSPIPEAGTMSLLGFGLVGLSIRLRRKK